MTVDMGRILNELGVETAPSGHKHAREGWVNIQCPYCSGNPGYHLGFNLEKGVWYCWRCGGGKKSFQVLLDVSSAPVSTIKRLLREYGRTIYHHKNKESNTRVRTRALRLPSDTGPLTAWHKKYLRGRGFYPDRLEKEWRLMSVGPTGRLDQKDYSNRILIPIYWNGRMVSFQCRTPSKKKQPKYKACPKDREIIEHQKILYGRQEAWTKEIIIVEGVTDVWRIGAAKAAAIFGVSFTMWQVRQICQHFDAVTIFFDGDRAGREAAKGIRGLLELVDKQVTVIHPPKEIDPGDMTRYEIKELIRRSKCRC